MGRQKSACALAVLTLASTMTACGSSEPAVMVSSECEQAMDVAANVPLAEVNDREVNATLSSCDSYSEWRAALLANPDVIGLRDLTQSDVEIVLQGACGQSRGAAVCEDARSRGLLPDDY